MIDGDREMPQRLGRYEVVERLAAGGMGEVFIARFTAPGGFVKPVAIKRIHPHLARDAQFIHMLHDEAKVTAAVRHPNIVATIDVGEDGGSHYIVLDYISGDTLGRILRELKVRQQTMPPWVVAWVGAQVASALHAAHEAKNLMGQSLDIIHRDISPGNIILSDDGHPMLFDFGVAKAKERLVKTAHGIVKGKLPYMAPETLRNVPVDRTVDIFSLGVTLYELLTGVSPFMRPSQAEVLLALRNGHVPPPSQGRPHIDSHFDTIVFTAMARDRAQRYATAAQLEGALRAWARAMGAPHEPGPVAGWLAATFPERLSAHRALMARVAGMAGAERPSMVSAQVSLPTPTSQQAPSPHSAAMFHQAQPSSGSYAQRASQPSVPSWPSMPVPTPPFAGNARAVAQPVATFSPPGQSPSVAYAPSGPQAPRGAYVATLKSAESEAIAARMAAHAPRPVAVEVVDF